MGLFSSSGDSKDTVDPKEAAKHIFTLAKAHADGRRPESGKGSGKGGKGK